MTYAVRKDDSHNDRITAKLDAIAAELGPQLDAAFAAAGLPNMLAPSQMFIMPPLVVVPTAADLIGRIKYLQETIRGYRRQILTEPNEILRQVFRDDIERKSQEVDRLDDCLAALGEKRAERVEQLQQAAE